MLRWSEIGLPKTVLLGLLLALSASLPGAAFAGGSSRGSLVWSRHTDNHGRYTGYYLYVARGFNVTVGANYYYGDIDNTGIAFNGGFMQQNFRGGVTLTYQHPLGGYCNLRSSFAVGALHAANTRAESYPKQFQSIYLEPSVCVDVYPMPWLGLYLFSGIGANASLIHYAFANLGGDPAVVERDVVRFLPMVPLGIGWAIPLGRASGLMLHIEASAHQGILDTPTMNLDAYPQTKAQNGVRDYGRSFQPGGKRTNEWADGYFQLGLTLSYRWN
jgi:hypothetical protein